MTSDKAVAGYFRVSIARDDMKAPEIYTGEVERYCRYRHLELREVFSDIDYSGYNNSEKRPGLNELVRRRAEFGQVVVPKLCRFGRSLKHLTQLFDLFDKDGIALVFLDLGMDTSTSQGRLLRNIMASFAEYESDVKADYSRANYRHAMEHGRVWGRPPFGYVAEGKRYHVVEPEADIVRLIYRRYLEGASLWRIATELNAAGIRGRKNGYWRTAQVGRALDNPAYAGLTVLDDQTFEAQWDAIVPRDTWQRVQTMRLPENRGHRTRKEGTGGPYLLSGFITCGRCGAKAHHHRKSNACMYRCMRQEHTQKCDGGGVSRDRADAIVTQAVLERVRFSFGDDVELHSASDAWEKASLEDRRRVLQLVIDRVVIEPRRPGQGRTAPRRLAIEWKPRFEGDGLVVAPLDAAPRREAPDVRVGRPESFRAGRQLRQEQARQERSRRARNYFAEWRRFRAACDAEREL